MIDEGELKVRYPEIPWDQPVSVSVIGFGPSRFVCRYCIAMHGLRGDQINDSEFVFPTREETLDHIDAAHHD